MASHREEELRAAARTLGAAARSAGFDPLARPTAAVEPDVEPAPTPVAVARRARTGVFDFEASEPVRRAA